MLALIKDFLGGRRCFPGKNTHIPFGCLSTPALLTPLLLALSVAHVTRGAQA